MKKYTVEITKLDENSNYFDRKQSLPIIFAHEDLQWFFHRRQPRLDLNIQQKQQRREREIVMQTAY